MTILISIPSYRKVELDTEKSHTVYCIGVNTATQSYHLEKRYSEFEALHKKLKKKRSDLPHFPSKSVLKWNPKVLETRRTVLEAYLQVDVVSGSEIPRSLLSFLNLPNIDSTQNMMPNLNNSSYNSAE
ncbi:hypothetical protein CAPTEDRAFT_105568 [Capitella teleta]|uniref:PX domain-containing protein n=1 Tax=Capitella teleta TaxID=283909 RepID=R7TCD4_CAPTE|nr:hypothetical protein CAPTEDRAFT_105568 [Capitella teleta]|eukprot:ELT89162.1 hypothetical protein CAPTEDRAFT_105568 [Capitella teleta]